MDAAVGQSAIERCRREQACAAAHIRAGAGEWAWMWFLDWLKEEVLLMCDTSEERVEAGAVETEQVKLLFAATIGAERPATLYVSEGRICLVITDRTSAHIFRRLADAVDNVRRVSIT